jgi:nicotinamide phosphoribosyltransferase
MEHMVSEPYKMSIDNIAFGMGGAMLQHPQRDWFKYAMKASAAQVDGVWRDISKDPVGDSSKRSKVGILALVIRDGEYKTILESELQDGEENILQDVYLNGDILANDTLKAIRERANKGMIIGLTV